MAEDGGRKQVVPLVGTDIAWVLGQPLRPCSDPELGKLGMLRHERRILQRVRLDDRGHDS